MRLLKNRYKVILFYLPMIFLAGCKFDSCSKDMWIDIHQGEPIVYDDMLEDICQADVIYLGERHTIDRHHDVQLKVISDLCEGERKIILGLEQLGEYQQEIIGKYNSGDISLDELVSQTDWPANWSNYQDYLPLLERVRASGGIVAGLNARSEIIRKVARMGIDKLDENDRSQLPQSINTDKPEYKKYLSKVMRSMRHVTGDELMMERMYTAQMCRDEKMAESLYRINKKYDSDDWLAIVVAGSGHVRNGAGMPECFKRRMPQVNDRIIITSSCGQLSLDKKMSAMSRDIEMTHEEFGSISNHVADYINVTNID